MIIRTVHIILLDSKQAQYKPSMDGQELYHHPFNPNLHSNWSNGNVVNLWIIQYG